MCLPAFSLSSICIFTIHTNDVDIVVCFIVMHVYTLMEEAMFALRQTNMEPEKGRFRV